MKHIPATNAEPKQNSESCEVLEFGNIGTIDGADIHITGRYPDYGFAVNKKSDLVIRMLSGEGKLVLKETEATLRPGDVAFVEHGEAYHFVGNNLQLFMVCTPAWSPRQYSGVE